jgi:uncharacterized alkaline shock family protein YloU
MTMTVVSEAGTITVTDSALTHIVVQAAEAVEGVRVRRPRPRRHVDIEIAGDGARMQIGLTVAYGRVLPEVARDVQRRVADAVGTMCAVKVNAVDITVEELAA